MMPDICSRHQKPVFCGLAEAAPSLPLLDRVDDHGGSLYGGAPLLGSIPTQ